MNMRTVIALTGLMPLPTAMALADELETSDTEVNYDEEKFVRDCERVADATLRYIPDYPGILWP